MTRHQSGSGQGVREAPAPGALQGSESECEPIIYAALHEIDGDPYNIRETLPDIKQLALSIGMYGLLENLVAVRIEASARTEPDRWLQLRAGSRRFEAIRQLATDGVQDDDGNTYRWPIDKPIPVLVLDSAGVWEHIAENVQRSDIKPWEVGRRLSEMASGGLEYREIALRVGRSPGWITRHVAIGRGLHPKTIEHIVQRKLNLNLGQLHRLSAIVDLLGYPDANAQIEALNRTKRRAPKQKADPASLSASINRLRYLESSMPVPPVLRPVVEAIVRYLKGEGSPNFRALHAQLINHQLIARRDEDFDDCSPEEVKHG